MEDLCFAEKEDNCPQSKGMRRTCKTPKKNEIDSVFPDTGSRPTHRSPPCKGAAAGSFSEQLVTLERVNTVRRFEGLNGAGLEPNGAPNSDEANRPRSH